MKETPIFEEVFMRFYRQPGIAVKLLIGGLLSFVPLVNLFAFGYLYRVCGSVRRSGSLELPEWQDWQGLLNDGLRFAVPWLGYWLLPVALAYGLSELLESIHLGAFAYLTSVLLLLAPVLLSAAVYRLQMRRQFKDLLDLPLIFRMAYALLPKMVIPALVIFGICKLCLPLYGFALFVSYLLFVAYTSLCYRVAERPTL